MVTRRNIVKFVAGSATASGISTIAGGQIQETTEGQETKTETGTETTTTAIFCLADDGGTLDFTLWVSDILDVTQAHVHLGGSEESGPPVAWLYPDARYGQQNLITGRYDGELETGPIFARRLMGPMEGKQMSALLDEIEAGQAYVNVHTQTNQDGAIRGQVVPVEEVKIQGEAATTTVNETESSGTDTGTEMTSGTSTESTAT